jgi:hypothetical protein
VVGLYKIIALIALIGGLIGIHVYDKHSAVKKAVQEVHTSYSIKFEQVDRNAKEKLGELLLTQQIERENKDEEIRNISVKYANTLRMLNDRKERPKDSVQPSQAGSSCTGRELYREDGQFLAGEASAAEKVIVDRNYYYEQYENARKMIERINNGK